MSLITADEFVENVQRRSTLAANSVLLDGPDILAFAYQMILAHAVPALISANGSYFTEIVDEALETTRSLYNIPNNASASSLGDLKYRRSATEADSLNYIEPEEEHNYRGYVGEPIGFNFRGDMIKLIGLPSSASHVLEFWIDRRPSRLALLEACGLVTAVADPTVTINALPDGWEAGTRVDFIRAKGLGRVMAENKAISGTPTTTVTFAASTIPTAEPSVLAAGDYLAPTGYSPVIQLPLEITVLLETWVSKRCMGSIGDFEAKKDLTFDEKTELENVMKVLEPRIREEARKIINNNGLLRGRRGFTKRRGLYG